MPDVPPLVEQSKRPSPRAMSALGSMPVRMIQQHGRWYLPQFAPGAESIGELVQVGMIECHDHVWRRTALGEAVWEHR